MDPSLGDVRSRRNRTTSDRLVIRPHASRNSPGAGDGAVAVSFSSKTTSTINIGNSAAESPPSAVSRVHADPLLHTTAMLSASSMVGSGGPLPPISLLEIPFSSSASSSLGDGSTIFSHNVTQGMQGTPPRRIMSVDTNPITNVAGTTSFKLKPRGSLTKHCPMSSRGRKRRAPSSLSVSSSTKLGGGSPPRCAISNRHCLEQELYTENSPTSMKDELSPGTSHPHSQSTNVDLSPGMSFGFQCLSLRSPNTKDTAAESRVSLHKPSAVCFETTSTPTSFTSGFSKAPSTSGGSCKISSPFSTGSSFRHFRSGSFETIGDHSFTPIAHPSGRHQSSSAPVLLDSFSVASTPKMVPLTVLTHNSRVSAKTQATTPPNGQHSRPPLLPQNHSSSSQPSGSTAHRFMQFLDQDDDFDRQHQNPLVQSTTEHLETRKTLSRQSSVRSSNSHETPTSIKQTPLPRISLTPRGSTPRSRGCLPRFPSPAEPEETARVGLDVSFLTTTSSQGVPTDTRSLDLSTEEEPVAEPYQVGILRLDEMQSLRKDTFIPFPAWADATPTQGTGVHQQEDGLLLFGFDYEQNHRSIGEWPGSLGLDRSSTGIFNKNDEPKYFTSPSQVQPSASSLQGIVVDAGDCRNLDLDSLSDDEDDDEFLLASPSAIAQEKQRLQHSSGLRHFKLPRLPRCQDNNSAINTELEIFHRRTSQTSMTSSNQSLKGMEFTPSVASLAGLDLLPSSTSLRGMDLPHQSSTSLRGMESVGENRYCSKLPWQQPTCLLRRESSTSIGLALDTCPGPTDSPNDRDLITPPPLLRNADCSPPLSLRFRSHNDEEYHQQTPPCCTSGNEDCTFLFVR